tara:strand:+ start:1137 stop:1421 length:285 start_codon:yes stop_codon:yes gene_type:complete
LKTPPEESGGVFFLVINDLQLSRARPQGYVDGVDKFLKRVDIILFYKHVLGCAPRRTPKPLAYSNLGTKKNVISSHFMLAITPQSVILIPNNER